MSRRSKFNLRDLVLGGSIKATTEVKKTEAPNQPAMEEKKTPDTNNTAEAAAMKHDLGTQDAAQRSEVLSEPPQTSSSQVSEKKEVVVEHSELRTEAAQQPSLKAEGANTKPEETDVLDPMKKFMQRKLPCEIPIEVSAVNPGTISASVDAATPGAEGTTTHATVEVKEKDGSKKIADVANDKSDGERQGSEGTGEVSAPVEETLQHVPEKQEEAATTFELGDDGASGPEEVDEEEPIKNRVAQRRIFPTSGNPIFSSDIDEWTPAHMASILEMMVCLNCNNIPSPNRLFQCPRGHLYCYECGVKRFTKDDKGDISSGTCDHEMKEEHCSTGSGSTRGIGYGLIHPNFQLAEGEVEELSKDEETGKAKCCLRIRKSKGDPLYQVMFNNTMWPCPFAKFGCKEILFGRDIADHVTPCMKKLALL